MKKLAVALTVITMLIGCSKEAEVALHESASDQVVYNTSGSFDIGALDANGNPYITYNQNDLKELAACAVSEDNVDGLIIDHIQGVGYYLSGVGNSSGSFTTFSIELSLDNSTLSWQDNAVIFTCEATSSTPCELDVISEQTYECDNTSGSCGQTIIGGEGGSSYAACNWPWKVQGKAKN